MLFAKQSGNFSHTEESTKRILVLTFRMLIEYGPIRMQSTDDAIKS